MESNKKLSELSFADLHALKEFLENKIIPIGLTYNKMRNEKHDKILIINSEIDHRIEKIFT